MGWPLIRIGDCCEVVSGATPKTDVAEFWDGSILWATPKDISRLNGAVLIDTPDKITEAGYKSCSTRLLPAGSVLVSSRAPIGLVAIAGREMCTNQGFKSLVPGPTIAPKYLYHCMKNASVRLAALGNGATFKEVSKAVVENFEIPLPPIKEQQRIAAILDKAHDLRQKRQETIRLSDRFLRSVFLKMFGDPAANPMAWPVGTVRDLVSSANYGTSMKASETEGQYPMLRMNNLTYEGRIDLSALKYIDLAPAEEHKYLARRGDVLFNRTNSKELVGKTAVYESDVPMAIAGYLVRVRVNERGNPHYLSGYLNSAHCKRLLQLMCKSIVGMANINAQEMQNIEIMIPPRSLQDRYASLVEHVRQVERRLSDSLNQIELVCAGLSQRFFS